MSKFDPNTPSVARVYDYVLGGKDNYQADRDVADRLLTIVPLIADMAVENRQFLSRASVLHYDGNVADEGLRTYSSEVTTMYVHTMSQVSRFFGSLELVPPGVVDARQWHQDREQPALAPRAGFVLAGVGRKR